MMTRLGDEEQAGPSPSTHRVGAALRLTGRTRLFLYTVAAAAQLKRSYFYKL
jgi:hypothetical protein